MAEQDEPGAAGHAGSGEDDAFELRLEPLRYPASAAAHGRGRGRSRLVGMALCALAVVAVVVGAFALAAGDVRDLGGARTTSPGSRPTTAIRLTPSPTPVAYPTPTLIRGTPAALGAAPATCTPPAPAPRSLSRSFAGAIGGSPVWVAGFDGPQATKHLGAGGLGYSRYGWLTNLLVAVEPGVNDPVLVRGARLADGSPLWIGVIGPGQRYDEATPTVAVVLDPRRPSLPTDEGYSMLGAAWALWPAALYIPAAGCYALDAIWPGGSWRLTFAVGR